jgi:hypothetical protein
MLIRVYDGLGLQDLRQMEAEAYDIIQQADNVIHAIVDLRGFTGKAQDIQQALGTIRGRRHKNQGTSVLIFTMKNPIGQFVAETILDHIGLPFKVTSSFEDAEIKIAKLERQRKKSRAS